MRDTQPHAVAPRPEVGRLEVPRLGADRDRADRLRIGVVRILDEQLGRLDLAVDREVGAPLDRHGADEPQLDPLGAPSGRAIDTGRALSPARTA